MSNKTKNPLVLSLAKAMFKTYGTTFVLPPKVKDLTNVVGSRSLTSPTRCGPDVFQTFCQALRKGKGLRPLFLNLRLLCVVSVVVPIFLVGKRYMRLSEDERACFLVD